MVAQSLLSSVVIIDVAKWLVRGGACARLAEVLKKEITFSDRRRDPRVLHNFQRNNRC